MSSAGWIVASALLLTLARAFTARRDEVEMFPFKIVKNLFDGTLEPDEWREQADLTGVSGLSLSA